MGEFDDLAAKYGVKAAPAKPAAEDAYDDLATRYGVDASRVDVGPEARRARGGGSPSRPRDLTAEEAGTSPGPIAAKADVIPGIDVGGYHESQPHARADAPPTDYVTRKPTPGGGETIRAFRGNPNEMADPLVQAGTAYAVGRGAGALAGAITPAAVAPVVSQAVEGGTANKAMGGDFTTGAALAAGPLALRTGARAATEAVVENAPARVAARRLRNLTEDAGKKKAGEISRVAGQEGQQLDEVVRRNPDLDHALSVHAKDRPAAALKAVSDTKSAANASRAADFETMQTYWADKPAEAQASISQLLDDYKALRKTNLGDRERQAVLKKAEDELRAFGDDLREAQGLPPAANGDYSGTVVSPKDLRAFEQTIGSRAYEGLSPQNAASAKRRVSSELYKPLAKQVNALAENTPGIDAKKFAQTGEDIHVLIPIEDELATRVERQAQGKKNLVEMARHYSHTLATGAGLLAGAGMHSTPLAVAAPAAIAAMKVGGRIGRGIDYRIAKSVAAGRVPSPPVAAPVVAPAVARGVAASAPARREPSMADLYAPAM